MSSPVRPHASAAELPPVDARLVAPGNRYEIQDGSLVYVSPADEPRGSRHSKISVLLEAHVGDEWDVASDMLTRTSETSDVAPDASVFARSIGSELFELAPPRDSVSGAVTTDSVVLGQLLRGLCWRYLDDNSQTPSAQLGASHGTAALRPH